MYLSVCVPSLQTGGFAYFVKTQLWAVVPSTMIVAPMSQPFVPLSCLYSCGDGA